MTAFSFFYFLFKVRNRIEVIGAVRADDLLCGLERKRYLSIEYQLPVKIAEPELF